jgi:hypothetical protein
MHIVTKHARGTRFTQEKLKIYDDVTDVGFVQIESKVSPIEAAASSRL